jgi:hypothetical protein
MRSIINRSFKSSLIGLALIAASGTSAHAYLGSYGPNDGYNLSMFAGGNNWCDVTYYNAGAYGANAGGGFAANIAPDSGLWKLRSQNGAFFATNAARNAQVGTAPPYTAAPLTGGATSYIVGAHFSGRNNDGFNLALRNDNPSGFGAIVYDYSLDTFDTGGPVAALQNSGTVTYETYFMTDPDSPPNSDGTFSDKFRMSFMDSLGNIGAEWGYSRDNQVAYRDGPSSNWTYTTWNAGPANWNGIRMALDLTADTFSFDYYDEASNTWNPIIAGASMGTAMGNFTTIRWQLEDAVNFGIGGKNFFDDSSFTGFVPAPGVAGLLLGGALMTARRRRA